jgi:hypothetical protein
LFEGRQFFKSLYNDLRGVGEWQRNVGYIRFCILRVSKIRQVLEGLLTWLLDLNIRGSVGMFGKVSEKINDS